MLFHKKTQKAAKVAWMIIGVLVIVSMVIFYAPIF
jgi:predicted nucleic acid-binding Zn ribbon protein